MKLNAQVVKSLPWKLMLQPLATLALESCPWTSGGGGSSPPENGTSAHCLYRLPRMTRKPTSACTGRPSVVVEAGAAAARDDGESGVCWHGVRAGLRYCR